MFNRPRTPKRPARSAAASKSNNRAGEQKEFREINEGHKIWKMNTPFLYDMVMTQPLEWPSVTVQWLPDQDEPHGEDYSVQKMILGTFNRAKGGPNYLSLARVQLPNENAEIAIPLYDDSHPQIGGFGAACRKVEIVQKIKHNGEVNRARYMPQNPFMIATKTVSGEVYVFDYRKYPSNPPLGGACNPDLRLKGHNAEGYGLSWSIFKQGHLLSGSDDAQICLWDINATPENKALDALQIFKVHVGAVQDVAWHSKHEFLFGSAGEDNHLHMWDLRGSADKPSQSAAAHESSVNCLAFSPFNEWVVATGSSDKTVKLLDIRKISSTLYSFDSHTGEVLRVGWSPKNETILASCARDRRLLIWDTSRIGQEQAPEDAVDGPPELLFIHGGHTNSITDFSWNPHEDWVIASVAVDNILQVWQIPESFYDDADSRPPPKTASHRKPPKNPFLQKPPNTHR